MAAWHWEKEGSVNWALATGLVWVCTHMSVGVPALPNRLEASVTGVGSTMAGLCRSSAGVARPKRSVATAGSKAGERVGPPKGFASAIASGIVAGAASGIVGAPPSAFVGVGASKAEGEERWKGPSKAVLMGAATGEAREEGRLLPPRPEVSDWVKGEEGVGRGEGGRGRGEARAAGRAVKGEEEGRGDWEGLGAGAAKREGEAGGGDRTCCCC